MNPERRFFVPPGGPPQGIQPNPEIYIKMGEENIFRMIADLYSEIEKSTIRHLFPENMPEASKKSAAFFVHILGGPPLYHQLYGPPMMRKRHMAFIIDEPARQVWLGCFKKTLVNADKKYSFPMEHMESFWNFLEKFSGWMVNTQ